MTDYPSLNYKKLRKGIEAELNHKKIKHIMIWQSGNVSVSTTDKSKLPECNGCILDPKVIKNISKNTSEITKVSFGDGELGKVTTMDLSWWFKQERENVLKNLKKEGK